MNDVAEETGIAGRRPEQALRPSNVPLQMAAASHKRYGHDWLLLLAGIALPVAAMLLVVVDSEWIAPRFFPDFVLPHSCFSRTTLGIDCPACGLTRSAIYLFEGRIADSLAMHRLGWLACLLIVGQVPFRVYRLAGRGRDLSPRPRTQYTLWGCLIGLFLASWLWDQLQVL